MSDKRLISLARELQELRDRNDVKRDTIHRLQEERRVLTDKNQVLAFISIFLFCCLILCNFLWHWLS